MPIFAQILKRYLAIILILSLTASSFQRYMIYAGFALNQNYIAKNLCINRSRPWMHCNGHCFFMRKIKEAQENEKKQTEKDSLNRLEVSFFQQHAIPLFILPITGSIPATELPEYKSFYSYSFSASLLQPPRPNA